MAKKLLCIIFLLIVSTKVFCQDPTFSQFYANPLYLAPSFAGAVDDYRLALNYRNQWPAVASDIYNTYSVSFDKNFEKYNSGIGILATYDMAGTSNLGTINIGLLYSYDFKITNDWHIRPGINFKYMHVGLDIYKLIFISRLISSSPSIIIPPYDIVNDIDFSSSIITYNDNMWGGVTVDHLLKPNTSFYGSDSHIPIKFNLFGGIQIFNKPRLITKRSHYDNFTVAFNFQKQEKFYQTDVGSYYNTDIFVLGLWYRGIPLITSEPGDALIGLIGIKTENFNIGYSYDFTISSLKFATSGSHEISLTYKFASLKRSNGKQRIRALPCPDF